MTYTDVTHYEYVHLTRITPLDRDVVRFALTVRVQDAVASDMALFAALALTGTKKKSKEQIEDYMKQYGIALTVTPGASSVTWSGSVRSIHANRACALVTELITDWMLRNDEWSEKRDLLLEYNREAHDNAKRIAEIAFLRAIYTQESTIYPQTLSDEKKAILATTEEHTETLATSLLQGEWHVSIVADELTTERFMPLVYTLSRSAGSIPYQGSIKPLTKPESFHIPVPSKTNIEVRLGAPLELSDEHSDYIPLSFGLDVLGKIGGFSGRLMSTVREKEGLTYGIYASVVDAPKGMHTHWKIFTFFTARDYAKGIGATLRELSQIVAKGITERELTTFKEIIRNGNILMHDGNASRLKLYHGLGVGGYREHDFIEQNARIETLTRKEVHKALTAHINPEVLVVSAAGPISKDGVPNTTA